ncbi:NADP-dependent 3-hydroxy acid dehydrogenase YdfG [Thioclava dalianensis]|nr:SDR family NAD(P)-dependent oxidoreductase [Thioclava dalianensis]SFN56956.1 NADP-dependent 3-hydroxy acid dehydrogenase YdfG [Thioclava dalianensis]
MDFKDKRIWIVGASSGIGQALARELHARGARLVLSARSVEPLNDLAAELGLGEVVQLDVSDPESLDDARGEILGAGPLDAMITTAALYDPGYVSEITRDKARQLIDVNLLGTLWFAQAAPGLLREGGQLVIFGSVAGYFGLPKGQLYSASKAAVINLVESLRVEYAPQIDVRLISPGFVKTRLTEKNDFDMPFVMEADAAARRIADGMAGRSFETHFPRRLTWGLKLLRRLPYAISLWLTGRM